RYYRIAPTPRQHVIQLDGKQEWWYSSGHFPGRQRNTIPAIFGSIPQSHAKPEQSIYLRPFAFFIVWREVRYLSLRRRQTDHVLILLIVQHHVWSWAAAWLVEEARGATPPVPLSNCSLT